MAQETNTMSTPPPKFLNQVCYWVEIGKMESTARQGSKPWLKESPYSCITWKGLNTFSKIQMAVDFASLIYFKHTTYTLASSCRSLAVKKLPGIAAPSDSLTEVSFLSLAEVVLLGLALFSTAASSFSRPGACRKELTRIRLLRALSSTGFLELHRNANGRSNSSYSGGFSNIQDCEPTELTSGGTVEQDTSTVHTVYTVNVRRAGTMNAQSECHWLIPQLKLRQMRKTRSLRLTLT